MWSGLSAGVWLEKKAINPLCEQGDTRMDISCVPFQGQSNRRETRTSGWKRKRLIKYRTEKVAGGLDQKRKKEKTQTKKECKRGWHSLLSPHNELFKRKVLTASLKSVFPFVRL